MAVPVVKTWCMRSDHALTAAGKAGSRERGAGGRVLGEVSAPRDMARMCALHTAIHSRRRERWLDLIGTARPWHTQAGRRPGTEEFICIPLGRPRPPPAWHLLVISVATGPHNQVSGAPGYRHSRGGHRPLHQSQRTGFCL